MNNKYKNLLIHPELIERFVSSAKELVQLHKVSFNYHSKVEKLIQEDIKGIRKILALNDSLTKAAEVPGVDLMEIKRRLTLIHTALQKEAKQTEMVKAMGDYVIPGMYKIRSLTKIFENGAKQLKKHRKDLAQSLIKMELMERKLKEAKDIFEKIVTDCTEYSAIMEEERKIYNSLLD